METLRAFAPKICWGLNLSFPFPTWSRIPGPALAGHPIGSFQTSGAAHLPCNHFTLECFGFLWYNVWLHYCQQAMTQSNCRFWQRPAEQKLNSEACYGFCENKLHQRLPRGLPAGLSSVFFCECACVSHTPCLVGVQELHIEWNGTKVSISQRFVMLSSRALGKPAWQEGRHSEKSLHAKPCAVFGEIDAVG